MSSQVTPMPDTPALAATHLGKDLVGWIWAVVAAFGAYFCMYAFRKPYTVAPFEEMTFWGVGFKTLLVTAQVIGYTVSKFIGIKVVAEMPPQRRAGVLVLLIGLGELALLGFALVPPPWNLGFLFLNGLPLGIVFGLVLGFLEGRRATEALTAGLCLSFIVADGGVQAAGLWLLQQGVDKFWMPFLTGLLFLGPQLLFVWMLTRIPPPSARDVALRSERVPMTLEDRQRLFYRYAPGLILIVLAYLLVTILRSIRNDFKREAWESLAYEVDPTAFLTSEMLVGLGVMLATATAVFIRDNRCAFFLALLTAIAGACLVLLGLVGLAFAWLDPFGFMVVIGLGLYIPYVSVHTTLFERLIALLRDRANLGYLMYLADAFGYLGAVAVLLARYFFPVTSNFRSFFLGACWLIGLGTVALLLAALCYFALRLQPGKATVSEA